MRIEITVENGKWMRADVVNAGKRVTNLYSMSVHPGFPLMEQYQDAVRSVKFNFPKYKDLEIVTDTGASETL